MSNNILKNKTSWPFGSVNFNAVDALVQSMLRCGQYFGAVNDSVRSMLRRDRCFGMIDVSVWSRLWPGG